MQYFGFDRPSFAFKTYGFGANFDPLDLFKDGKQGAWYDPSDKSTLFQDSNGTIPVTKDGDPVGLMLDKSQNLEKVKKVDSLLFIKESTNPVAAARLLEAESVPTGALLEITLDIKKISAPHQLYLEARGASSKAYYLSTLGINALGIYKVYIYKAEDYVQIRGISTSEIECYVTVEVLKGNHASQSVSAARPTYKKDATKAWLYHDKVDDQMLVTLPAMTATVVTATDDGVTINYPVSITAGDYAITSTSALGRDYSYMIINKELSVSEATQVTSYFNAKRGV